MEYRSTCIFLLVLCHQVFSQFDCPLEWIQYEQNCYKFTFYPTESYIHATGACQSNGASLLSVNDDAEHEFISNWLGTNVIDKNLDWYTSGMNVGGHSKWEGDGSALSEIGHWVTDATVNKKAIQTQIIYTFDPVVGKYWWGWTARIRSIPYICEISQAESYRINEAKRDFTYGSTTLDERKIEKGPKIIQEPLSVLIIKGTVSIHLECAATALPNPVYHWYKNYRTAKEMKVDDLTDSRYTMTNGRFTIWYPDMGLDPGDYQCIIENKFGSIISDPVQIVAGYLSEFSNEPAGVIRGIEYQGAVITCNTPAYNPDVNFQWFKEDIRQFIRPRLNLHTFISKNGKLYFSELQPSDHGQYFCVISLTTPQNIVMATNQAPSETSLGIGLTVASENANEYGPLIHNDFPAVFPSPPVMGQNLRLECFAYGKLPMYYRWDREAYGLPSNISFDDSQRVMIIYNARLEDSGSYTCNVRRGKTATASKSLFVAIEAKPYFMFPLQNQHLDNGSRVSWRCQAIAVPRATYTWYKNTQPLTTVAGDHEVRENVLTIESVDKRHEGMYQCRAENTHGVTYSNAQLRILSFKPTFAKHPLKSTVATEGGNITIICSPEGAPFPTITWKKDGRDLGLSVGTNGRQTLLSNGNLVIEKLTKGDEGKYTCEATNEHGSDSSTATIFITTTTSLVHTPSNTKALINNTAYLYCEASYDANKHDLVYIWFFYGRQIKFEDEPHYTLGSRDGVHGLYIRNAQYIHQGMYKCAAQTPQDVASASAFLTVYGPPGEPAGVYAKNIVGRSLDLRWTPGELHGSAILKYRIEYLNKFEMMWKVLLNNVDISQVVLTDDIGKHGLHIDNLTPGNRYQFRVWAYNMHGYGTPSIKTKFYNVNAAPPVTALSDVWGGQGSVGELRVLWQPLQRAKQGGPGFHYRTYWRKKENNFGRWLASHNVDGNKDRFITIIERNNYYTQYEVKVQVFNSRGAGPNSTIRTIYSAEDLPLATPEHVEANAINATAMTVSWNPVVDDRQHMKGRIKGYQVNYWVEGKSYNDALFVRHLGQMESGDAIGLIPNAYYWVNAQVYNSAGLGPKSEDYRVGMNGNAPTKYPEFVNVTSRDEQSVNVWWRGIIHVDMNEEVPRGYKMRYWEAGDNMETARDIVVAKTTHGVIDRLQLGKVYKLRVLGYSAGGDGKKSPTVYFTLGGPISIDTTRTEILAKGFTIQMSIYLILINLIILKLL